MPTFSRTKIADAFWGQKLRRELGSKTADAFWGPKLRTHFGVKNSAANHVAWPLNSVTDEPNSRPHFWLRRRARCAATHHETTAAVATKSDCGLMQPKRSLMAATRLGDAYRFTQLCFDCPTRQSYLRRAPTACRQRWPMLSDTCEMA